MKTQNDNRSRITILVGAPITPQSYKLIGIPELIKDFEVIILDLREWWGRKITQSTDQKLKFDGYEFVNSYESFRENIMKLQPLYALGSIHENQHSGEILEFLSDNQVQFILLSRGSLPNPTILARIKYFLPRIYTKKVANEAIQANSISSNQIAKSKLQIISLLGQKLKNRISDLKEMQQIKNAKPLIGIFSGRKANTKYAKFCKEIFFVPSLDFETFTMTSQLIKKDKEKYIIFIDDNLVSGSDFVLLNIIPPVDREQYFAALNHFFQELENHFNAPVKIAAHPSSQNDHFLSARMGGRTIVHNKTAELVINSYLVLAHASTAISFAVLARKPILFMTTQDINRSYLGLIANSMSQLLGSKIANIDEDYSTLLNEKLFKIKEKRYEKYTKNFIFNVKESIENPWSPIIAHLQKQTTDLNIQHYM